jgi:hypothetical protein
VTDSWTDPASLQGDALTQWYLRSPADVERQRQAGAAQRYQDFFHGGPGNDPDPGFRCEVPASSQDVDPVFAMRPPLAGGPTAPPSKADGVITYGALRAPAPSDQELAELRRQQAAFSDTTRKIDLQNSWFAAPVLAAPLAVMGLEGAAAWAARSALPEAEQAVLEFIERDPYPRVGDNWATRAGRRAHAALKERWPRNQVGSTSRNSRARGSDR